MSRWSGEFLAFTGTKLVGEELVREALSRRGLEGPRYRIRDEDLERVIGSNAVRAEDP